MIAIDFSGPYAQIAFCRYPLLQSPLHRRFLVDFTFYAEGCAVTEGDLLPEAQANYEYICEPEKPYFVRHRPARMTEVNIYGLLGTQYISYSDRIAQVRASGRSYRPTDFASKLIIVGLTWFFALLMAAPFLFWYSFLAARRLIHQGRFLEQVVCNICRYDLRGSVESANCPECGTPISDEQKSRIRQMLEKGTLG